jgi:SAM-dependent methyltransferase
MNPIQEPPAGDASRFGRMKRATGALPWTHWQRHVILEIRAAVAAALHDAGVGSGWAVVDMGCGNCPHEETVTQRGARYDGADFPGNAHAKLTCAPDGRVPAADGSYDAVMSVQVLEHVEEPQAYLAEARRLLKPGGKLILSTHGIWVYHPEPLDYWRWTAPGLKLELERAGFKVLKMSGLIGMLGAGLQLIQDQVYMKLQGRWKWLRKPWVLLMQPLITLADRLQGQGTKSRDAMIYMVLAEVLPPGK